MKQVYYNVVQKRYGNAKEFFNKVNNICIELGISNSDWLCDLMHVETAGTFRVDIKNQYSSATGLIQFLESTAIDLGTTTAKLRLMSNLTQLDYVRKYLKQKIAKHGKPLSYFDTYCLVFYPAWVRQPDSAKLPDSSYAVNKGIDLNKDKIITRGEFRQWAEKQVGIVSLPISDNYNLVF
ncbi:hypothetical protein B0I27_109114 [Arcticibacter pallidicorallinus]|uniref:EF-hand domain-containing protein n=1 Tax=Arcticibacter pallidicorallinus TaxID=1259464 RepID=A0A2T0TXK0_9SPHI|nr:hypothetical protein [Arcticibacter pallidicorallinus]PRY50391.1 hypothetical protein B0I27_109114 [Arcticibacter pallidicorallinus]